MAIATCGVLNSACTLASGAGKYPSVASANSVRGVDSIVAVMKPNVEMTIAMRMNVAPAGPANCTAAAASGALAVSGAASARPRMPWGRSRSGRGRPERAAENALGDEPPRDVNTPGPPARQRDRARYGAGRVAHFAA